MGTITKSFDSYQNISHQLQLLDVAFEKDQSVKQNKIISYKFTEQDIEEAYLFPLNFHETELIGKDSELYERRQLIKATISNWTNMSSEQKTAHITENKLSPSDVSYIISTTRAITSTKEKVLKK